MLLSSGDTILLDFDGTVVEDCYPQFGQVKPGVKEFLDKCKANSITVLIWTARCNHNPKFPVFGYEAVQQVKEFMDVNNLYFSGFYLHQKPIGQHFAKCLVDDRTVASMQELTFPVSECPTIGPIQSIRPDFHPL
jgi:hypothetical protein